MPRPLAPCLPSRAAQPPAGPDWTHEIKHDGFRLLAWRDSERVRLYTRGGYDWRDRYTLIAEAVAALAVRSCTIDGEVIVCDGNGLADFELLRSRRHDGDAVLCAFDLLQVDGRDLCREPIEDRQAELAELLADCRPGLVLNKMFIEPGDVVFKHACALGVRRRGLKAARIALSGRTDHWRKVKNPNAPGGAAGSRGRVGQVSNVPVCRRAFGVVRERRI
jgi:bifunctional non-homologous end joining protein LigD